MIQNANETKKRTIPGKSVSVLQTLKRRRQTILDGGINCIPFKMSRFRADIPGIEAEQYIIFTASTKVGKTQCASDLYLYTAIDYAYEHPEQCDVHILYFPWEESPDRITERYMSHLLFQLDGYRIPPTDLRSTSSDAPVPEEVLALLESEEYQKRLAFFDKCVEFVTDATTPTQVMRKCEEYALSVGTSDSGNVSFEELWHEKGSDEEEDKSSSVQEDYEQADPKLLKMMFIDTLNLVESEDGISLKQSIDRLSRGLLKVARNKYKYNIVAIQQQAAEGDGLEAIKQKKIVPSITMLGDSKYPARDACLVLGLFSPDKFGLSQWLGYKVADPDGTGLHGYARFLYVLANRNGEIGGICPMFFDGAVCNFEELPLPDDINGVTKYYQEAKSRKTLRQTKKFSQLVLLLLTKLFTHS